MEHKINTIQTLQWIWTLTDYASNVASWLINNIPLLMNIIKWTFKGSMKSFENTHFPFSNMVFQSFVGIYLFFSEIATKQTVWHGQKIQTSYIINFANYEIASYVKFSVVYSSRADIFQAQSNSLEWPKEYGHLENEIEGERKQHHSTQTYAIIVYMISVVVVWIIFCGFFFVIGHFSGFSCKILT